jgi:hypothetical protein
LSIAWKARPGDPSLMKPSSVLLMFSTALEERGMMMDSFGIM